MTFVTTKSLNKEPDKLLIISSLLLLIIGQIMVFSSSLDIAAQYYKNPFFFFKKQIFFLTFSLIISFFVYKVPLNSIKNLGPHILILGILSLIALKFSGLGKTINGSTRWLNIGFNIQVSELCKLCVIIYISYYLEKYGTKITEEKIRWIIPVLLTCLFCAFFLFQPDFGASVVLTFTMMGLLFLTGVPIAYFLTLLGFSATCFILLALISPYRLKRILGFLNPWANQFQDGYQLTQSLIAIGKGGLFGQGLGESVQKLFYLPEAYTDFIFAILVEELGLFAGIFTILCYIVMITRLFFIGKNLTNNQIYFAGYICLGTGLWFSLQTIINLGVCLGVLPTKGLTLPFLSYGGSSLIINCIALTLCIKSSTLQLDTTNIAATTWTFSGTRKLQNKV